MKAETVRKRLTEARLGQVDWTWDTAVGDILCELSEECRANNKANHNLEARVKTVEERPARVAVSGGPYK